MRKYNIKRELEYYNGNYRALDIIKNEIECILAQTKNDKIDLTIIYNIVNRYIEADKKEIKRLGGLLNDQQ